MDNVSEKSGYVFIGSGYCIYIYVYVYICKFIFTYVYLTFTDIRIPIYVRHIN